jgi:hypothetical protein
MDFRTLGQRHPWSLGLFEGRYALEEGSWLVVLAKKLEALLDIGLLAAADDDSYLDAELANT